MSLARNVLKKAQSRVARVRRRVAQKQLASPGHASGELSFSGLMSLPDPNDRYRYAYYYFWKRAPQLIRDHRGYFKVDGRGYGEDAFHTMWYLLILERRPLKMLEIGVYRGQTVSLWALIAKYLNQTIETRGVSPLSDLGDEVSTYPRIDYPSDIATHFAHFDLGAPTLTRALSTEPSGVAAIVDGGPWDVVYIDGGHDYSIVEADFRNALAGLSEDGLIVMDDASLFLPFDPPLFASKGHPGPSRVAEYIASVEMQLLGSVGHNLVFARR